MSGTLLPALFLAACGGSTTPSGTPDGATAELPPADTTPPALDTGRADTGSVDVTAGDATVSDACAISCAMPPPGCAYEGPVTCSPPSCGRLVCADGGAGDAADGTARDTPGTDGSSADSAGTDSAADAPSDRPTGDAPVGDGGVTMTCGSVTVPFPAYTGRCSGDADCALGLHQSNCCGDVRAIGIEATLRMAFEAAEALCRPGYPGCGCPTRGILADDDRWTLDPRNVGVACRAGRCTTFVRGM
jgi:hypothetical protein